MALHKETDDILFAELPVRQGIRAADAFEEGHEPLERKHPLRGGLRFMRGDEQAAAFGPQTLKQREDAGVRRALGEGAAKIEVTECGHMPGDFRFVGVRADFTENTFQRRADDGERHPRDRIARVTQDGGNGFENVRRAIHKRAVKVKENGRERERGKLHQKLLAMSTGKAASLAI